MLRRDTSQDREPETVDKHKWSVVGGQDGVEDGLLGPGCPPGERQGKKPRSRLYSLRQRPLQPVAVPFINFAPLKVNVFVIIFFHFF